MAFIVILTSVWQLILFWSLFRTLVPFASEQFWMSGKKIILCFLTLGSNVKFLKHRIITNHVSCWEEALRQRMRIYKTIEIHKDLLNGLNNNNNKTVCRRIHQHVVFI